MKDPVSCIPEIHCQMAIEGRLLYFKFEQWQQKLRDELVLEGPRSTNIVAALKS